MGAWKNIFLTIAVGSTAIATQNLSNPGCVFEVGAPVNTTSGIVYGHRAPNATQVSEYLGIPFAQKPLGALRFAPPVAFKGTGKINATDFGHDCATTPSQVPTFLEPYLYNLLSQLGQVNDDPSEDCLYINVWSKPQSSPTSQSLKPVLVWIYGGGFTSGGTNTSAYSGQFWAETEDVVFVNFNYRLSIFGFPGGPNLEQNVGLLDQRLAIEWVRDNIAGFGGDPSRITIFGQSAGGASVDYYNYAWTEDPIIAGSISQSGTATAFGNKLPATASKAWYNVASKLGCGNNMTDPATVLACMRSPNITTADLLSAESAGSGLSAILGNFGPTIDNKTVFSNYSSLAQEKKFIQKPSIYGNNIYEAGLFILIAAGTGLTLPMQTWVDFDAGVFTCPISTAAEWHHYSDLPVWRYIYAPEFPNEVLPTSNGQAWHGAELLPMFGSSESVTLQDSTWQERSMGSYMRGAWAAFARCPESGLTQYGWQQYSNTSTSLLQLGFDNVSSTTFSVYPTYNTSQAYDSMCGTFPYGGAANA